MRNTNGAKNRTWLWFLLFCMLPLAVVLIMAGMGWNVGNLGFLALLLICPISMFWMMRQGGCGRDERKRSAAAPSEAEQSEEPHRR